MAVLKKSKLPVQRSIDSVCKMIADGQSLTAIAQAEGVSKGSLSEWLEATPERSARARMARAFSSRVWDDKATQVIEDAGDPFELAKAKELAHHYRWRASKIAPADYGDRTTVAGDPKSPLTVAAVSMTRDEFTALALELASKV